MSSDRSQIYDLRDEGGEDGARPGDWALILDNSRAVYCRTEADAALAQRIWRALNGFHPILGDSVADYVGTVEEIWLDAGES
jgi:hypothetical protein